MKNRIQNKLLLADGHYEEGCKTQYLDQERIRRLDENEQLPKM